MRARTLLACRPAPRRRHRRDGAVHRRSRSRSCLPQEDNGLVRAAITSLRRRRATRRASTSAGGSTRTSTGWPWKPSPAAASGRRRPSPRSATSRSSYYGALVDAAGKVVARSESQIAPVTNDCKVQLSPKERGVAENLTVGETSPKQQGKKVLAFLCDGVVTRINSRRRPPLRRGLPGLRHRLVAAQGGADRPPSPASSAWSSPTGARALPLAPVAGSDRPGLSPFALRRRTLECGRVALSGRLASSLNGMTCCRPVQQSSSNRSDLARKPHDECLCLSNPRAGARPSAPTVSPPVT